MPATATGQIHARLAFNISNTVASGINVPINVDLPGATATVLDSGTGANQITYGWADTRTLATTSVELNLNALAAAPTNTGAAAFTSFTGIKITNDPTSGGIITIGNATTAQALFNGVGGSSTVILKPGGSYLYHDASAAGQVCTTNKFLKIDAAASCTVSVGITGRV